MYIMNFLYFIMRLISLHVCYQLSGNLYTHRQGKLIVSIRGLRRSYMQTLCKNDNNTPEIILMMKLITMYVVVYFSFVWNNLISSNRIVVDYRENLRENCLKGVVELLFKDTDSVCIISDNHHHFFPENLNKTYVHVNLKSLLTGNDGRQYGNYVIYLSYFMEFVRDIIKLRTSQFWDVLNSARGNYLIINDGNDSLRTNVYKYLWEYDIYKVVIMQNDEDGKFYSANPFLDKNKVDVNEDELGTCQNYTGLTFIDYVLHMDNQNFYHSTGYYYLPYTGTPNTKYQGITLSLLNLIKTKINITIVYHISSYEENNEFYTTGMTNITRDMIYNRSLDLFFISNLYLHYWDTYEVTKNAYLEEQMWIIAKAPMKIGGQINISLLKKEIWIGLILTYVFVSITFWIIAKIERAKYDIFASFHTIFAATLSNSYTSPHLRSKYLKIILLLNIIYSFIINNTTHGNMSSRFTHPGDQKGISTFYEMLYSDVIPFWHMQKISLLKTYNTSIAISLRKKSIPYDTVSSPRNRVEFVRTYTNYCTTAYESYLQLYGTDGIKIIGHEFLIPHEIRFGMRKGHPFIPHINRVINSIAEGGFTTKWVNDIRNITANDRDTTKSHVRLTVAHLEGAFDIFGIGSCIAIIILISERIVHKITRK